MNGEQGEWRDRIEALKREKPAQLAILAAIVAVLCALIAWTLVLLPSGRDIRGQPLFWLMALPAMIWMGALQNHSAWAIRTLPVALGAAPLLSLAALLTAPGSWSSTAAQDRLATPLTMQVMLGITAALGVAGVLALRRSSLPGGGQPARFLPPGSVLKEITISATARGALAVGSLALSGTLINGVFFSIMTILPAEKNSAEFGAPWPATIPAALAVLTAVFMVRGAIQLRQGNPRALQDLAWSWRTGAWATGLLPPLAWAWPGPADAKLAFSLFMVPIAIATVWGASSARRRLRAAPESALGRQVHASRRGSASA